MAAESENAKANEKAIDKSLAEIADAAVLIPLTPANTDNPLHASSAADAAKGALPQDRRPAFQPATPVFEPRDPARQQPQMMPYPFYQQQVAAPGPFYPQGWQPQEYHVQPPSGYAAYATAHLQQPDPAAYYKQYAPLPPAQVPLFQVQRRQAHPVTTAAAAAPETVNVDSDADDTGRVASQLRAMKRLHDESVAEREVTTKYRKLAGVSSTDPVTQARISQMQYATSKFAEVERLATVMAKQLPPGSEEGLTSYATQIRSAADSGARALAITMFAVARGPELGEGFVVRAAGRAMNKDIADFSATAGISSVLDEEFEKRETALATAKTTATGAARTPNPNHKDLTCHICNRVGHIAMNCIRDAPTARPKTKAPAAAQSASAPPEPSPPS